MPVNVIAARYCTAPNAMMLIATPDTMWSTPKITVAIPCSNPPSAPNRIAPTTPTQAPYS